MRKPSWIGPLTLVSSGLALLAWVLYDATSLRDRLWLASVMDEASVALLGLAVSSISMVLGIALLRRARVRAAAQDAA